MYSITFDRDRALLDIAWRGVFDADQVTRYASDCIARFTAQGFRAGYRLRIDMSASAVQPRATLAAFDRCFRDFPKASRIAVVTPSALYRLQVRRIMTQPYMRIFAAAPDALDWLLATTPDGATAPQLSARPPDSPTR